MTDFETFSKSVTSTAKATGLPPKPRDFFWIKLTEVVAHCFHKGVENIPAILLVCLTLVFAYFGVFTSTAGEDGKKWCLNAANLCLGVFLGLFAARRSK